MSSYIGRHADLYDLFYADKPYAQEAAFVHQCLQRYTDGPSQHILELACGTGSHALALEKLGYDITAIDYSEDMLNWARRKAAAANAHIQFYQQDMRALDVAGRPFDAVICLFDSIGYVGTNEALLQVLAGVHRHLRPEGLFVFDLWYAGAMLKRYDPVRVRRWSVPEGEVLRISETTLDHVRQFAHVMYTVYELRRDGTYSSFQETQTNRYFLVQEMAGLLAASGFIPVKWFSGFTEDNSISEATWHVVAVACRS
jgi:SAM-dependent methyltransferase